jgi:hypothetical protein
MFIECRAWEESFSKIPGVESLRAESAQNHLQEILINNTSMRVDSFAYSLPYYIFTGRNGAWVYWLNNVPVIVCWHPNRNGDLLVYPAGCNAGETIVSLFDLMPNPPGKVQIARISDVTASNLEVALQDNDCIGQIRRTDEPVLDWLFPAHVLSTEKASSLSGNKFYYARRKYRSFDESSFAFEEFAAKHVPDMQLIGQKYARVFKSLYPEFVLTPNEILKSHEDMLSVALKNKEIMNSVVLKYQGQTVGMFVWDVIGNTANALWFVFDREIDNLGFAQVVEASRMLQKQGIEYLNLGGSETEGMDFFKTRFRPVQSFPLTSVFVEFEKHSIVSVAA